MYLESWANVGVMVESDDGPLRLGLGSSGLVSESNKVCYHRFFRFINWFIIGVKWL